MGFWDTAKRFGKAWLTSGLSEVPGIGDSFDQRVPNTDPNNSRLQNGDYLRGLTRSQLLDIQGRQAPQAMGARVGNVAQGQGAQIATGPQGQFRDRTLALADRLNGVASGQQMGAGQMAVRQEGNRAIAQQQAMARMQRGGNAALAARGAATNVGNIGLNVAGQAGQAQRADAQMATQTMAGLLGEGRAQDIGLATGQAGMNQQMNLANMDARNQQIFQQAGLDQATSLANMQAKLQTMGMNDQAAQAYLAQLFNIDLSEMQARLNQEATRIGGTTAGPGWALVGQAANIGAQAAIASDRTLKKDVRKASSSIDDMLDKLEATVYRYKDEKHGQGRRAGIMAQDLEGSTMGRRVVRDTPEGKMLDVNAAISAGLAASARLNQRLRALEGKSK